MSSNHPKSADLRCRAGIHEWSEWHQTRERSCIEVSTCQRPGCGAKRRRANHSWSDWRYESDNDCTKIRSCAVCGLEDQKAIVDHTFVSRYVADNSCEQVSQCSRCGKKDPNPLVQISAKLLPEHVWSEWEPPGKCIQSRHCERCNKSQSLEQHKWGEWKYVANDSCEQTNACTSCGEKARRTSHIEGDWQYIEASSDSEIAIIWRYCSRCSKRVSVDRSDSAAHDLKENKKRLRLMIVRHFGVEDLKILCANLGLDHEAILPSAVGKESLVLALIEAMERNGMTRQLVEECVAMRPRAKANRISQLSSTIKREED